MQISFFAKIATFKSFLTTSLLFGIFIYTSKLQASIFNISITVGDQTIVKNHNSMFEIVRDIKLGIIKKAFPNYKGTEYINLKINFRGIPLLLTAQRDNSCMDVNIQAIGVHRQFKASTRKESMELFKTWLQESGASALDSLMVKSTEESAHDPLAGNPNSLMSRMVDRDFYRGSLSGARGIPKLTKTRHRLGINPEFYALDHGGPYGKTFSLPVNYYYTFGSSDRHQLILDLPISVYEVQEAKSYSFSLSVEYKFLFHKKWWMAFAGGTGLIGSIDLGSFGHLANAALKNHYQIKIPHFHISIRNMLSYYRALPISIAKYQSNPKFKSFVVTNGLFLTNPFELFFRKLDPEIFFTHSRYFGNKLYVNSTNELGVSFGSKGETCDSICVPRTAVSYLFTKKNHGLKLKTEIIF